MDVILARDRTLKERQHLSNQRETLNACIESGETDLTIKYVNYTRKNQALKTYFIQRQEHFTYIFPEH